MDRFIDVADDLRASSSSVSRELFDLFFDALQNGLGQLHAKTTVDLQNIESVFGLVEMGTLLRRLPGVAPGDIEQLSRATRAVLAQTVIQSGAFEFSDESWVVPEPYLNLVSALNDSSFPQPPDVALVSFNYDLALDFALHWTNIGVDYHLGPQRSNGVPLLKLHGSVNWVTCSQCGHVRAIPMENVFRAHHGRRVASTKPVRRALDPVRAHQGLGPHCEGDAHPYQMTLVPPSWNKTQYWEQLSEVWARAAAELAEAVHITVVGYSLPSTDAFFRDLLALGLFGPARVRSFRVINPDGAACRRFSDLLGPELQGRFEQVGDKFEDWVARAGRKDQPDVVR